MLDSTALFEVFAKIRSPSLGSWLGWAPGGLPGAILVSFSRPGELPRSRQERQNEPQAQNGWSTTVPSPSGWEEETEEPPDSFEREGDALTPREQLMIRLAVNITRGAEGAVRDQLDAARQLGIDKATLSAVINGVSKANADACRAVTAENL